MNSNQLKIKQMTQCAFFSALIAVSAFIQIPLPYLDYFTLQFLVIVLAGFLLGSRLGAIAVGLYIGIGLIGLPVFAAGGGFGYVLQPSFGYLIGFIFSAYVCGKIIEKGQHYSIKRYVLAAFAGLLVTYLIGLTYKYVMLHVYVGKPISWKILLLSCFPIDLPCDIALSIIAASIGSRFQSLSMLPQKKKRNFMLQEYKKRILRGGTIDKHEALLLLEADIQKLAQCANDIRQHFCSNHFDLCSIINGKSGKCSENCAYCAQSMYHQTTSSTYDLLQKETILHEALHNDHKGVHRFSIVTSGRALSKQELKQICEIDTSIKNTCHLSLCASHGLLKEDDFRLLKEAGVTRYHNNLETSRRYFPSICTTHTYDDKIETLEAARKAGLELCSGGIIGMGETFEDRIDLAITLRELHVTSIPINILSPIPGTPLAHQIQLAEEDIIRTVAIFRFLLPNAMIRLAGGRDLCKDAGKSLFMSGANAAITGDMLTTRGISIDQDKRMLTELGYLL